MREESGSLRRGVLHWSRAIWRPLLAFAVSLGFVAKFSDSHDRGLVVAFGLALLVAASWLDDTMRRERRFATYSVGPARVVFSFGLALSSAVLIAASRADSTFDPLGLAGIGLLVVALGGLISEARYDRRWEHVRGPVLLVAAFLAASLALVLFPTHPAFLAVVAVAFIVAEAGTELLSEDRLRALPQWSPRLVAALGLAVLVVAAGLLVAGGAGLVAASLVAVAVLAVVAMAAADNESLLLVLLIVAALLWASAPRSAGIAPELVAVPGDPYFLALGDSYISGEGAEAFVEGTNTSDPNPERTNKCRRAPTAWPVLLASATELEAPGRVLFLPCSGAVAADIRSTPRVDERTGERRGPAELLLFAAERERRGLSRPPEFVVVSVGGNDAGFGTLGRTCVGPGDCAQLGDEFLDGLRSVEPELDRTYSDIRAAVGPDVPLVAVPYPIPVSAAEPCTDVLLTENERRFVVAFVTELNRVVRSAAERAGAHYLDSMESSLADAGLRLCEARGESGLNFVDLNPEAGSLWESLKPTNWTHNSLHPNEEGHAAMARAAERWFRANSPLEPLTPAARARVEVATMSSLFEFGATELCGLDDGEHCDPDDGRWLYDQAIRSVRESYLAVVLAMVGAWMLVMLPIRYVTRHNLTAMTLVRRLLGVLRTRRRRRGARRVRGGGSTGSECRDV